MPRGRLGPGFTVSPCRVSTMLLPAPSGQHRPLRRSPITSYQPLAWGGGAHCRGWPGWGELCRASLQKEPEEEPARSPRMRRARLPSPEPRRTATLPSCAAGLGALGATRALGGDPQVQRLPPAHGRACGRRRACDDTRALAPRQLLGRRYMHMPHYNPLVTRFLARFLARLLARLLAQFLARCLGRAMSCGLELRPEPRPELAP